MLEDSHCAVDDELVACLQKTVDAAGRAGARIDFAARPDIDIGQSHALYIKLVRAVTTARIPAAQAAAFRRAAAELDPDDDSYKARLTRAVVQEHRDWIAANEARTKLRHKWAAFFDDHDVLLCPTAASAAFVHDHEGLREDRTILVNGRRESTMDQLFWAGLSGVVYLPSTVAPVGANGFRLAGGPTDHWPPSWRFNDHPLCRIAGGGNWRVRNTAGLRLTAPKGLALANHIRGRTWQRGSQ